MNFLIQSVNSISHDSCGYVDGEWLCVSYLSDSEQPTMGVKTSDSICLTEQPTIEAKTSDSICLSDSEQPMEVKMDVKTSGFIYANQSALELKKVRF